MQLSNFSQQTKLNTKGGSEHVEVKPIQTYSSWYTPFGVFIIKFTFHPQPSIIYGLG